MSSKQMFTFRMEYLFSSKLTGEESFDRKTDGVHHIVVVADSFDSAMQIGATVMEEFKAAYKRLSMSHSSVTPPKEPYYTIVRDGYCQLVDPAKAFE